jgi:hypothetical protein
MTKISQLSDIGASLAADDEFVVRDVSDGSTPNKKVTSSGIIDYVIAQGSVTGFTQIAAGAGPLARVLTSSSGTTGTVTLSTALSGSLVERARITPSGVMALAGAGTAAAPIFAKSDDLDTGVFFPAADTVAVTASGVERMRITGAGNVLIGTSTATSASGNAQLDVNFPYTGIGSNVDVCVARFAGDFLQRPYVAIHQAHNGNYDATGGPSLRFTTSDSEVPGREVARIEADIPSDGVNNNLSISVNNDTALTERIRIEAAGEIIFNNASSSEIVRTVNTGAYLRMAASSGGIQFNGDTAAANALNDYEEGTWTPSFESSNGNATVSDYNIRQGRYTKVGNLVYILFSVGASFTSVGTGDIWITGLPFTPGFYDNIPLVKGLVYNQYGSSFWTTLPGQVAVDGTSTRLALFDGTLTSITKLTTSAFVTGSNGANNRVHAWLTYQV